MTIARSGYGPDVGDEEVLSGRYALGPVIGRGSSALVRRGIDRFTGEPVAVKLFSAGASALDERRRRQELAALSAVDHPGLVRLRAGGMTEDRPFVVMDLVDGPTLAERLLDGPLPEDEVRALGARLADALAHVHALGFVHRDVKPANVLMGEDSAARLADFGIARALDDTSATATGFVVGTAAFLAPEQVRGEPVGPRADVYALGLVLLEALNGSREYPGSAVESATARLHRPPRVPPTPLGTVIAAMTTSEAVDRLDAAGAAAALLAPADFERGGGPVDTEEPTADHRVSTGRRWARRAAIPVAAAVLLGSVVAGTVGLLGGPAAGSLTASVGPDVAPTGAPGPLSPVVPPTTTPPAVPPADTGTVARAGTGGDGAGGGRSATSDPDIGGSPATNPAARSLSAVPLPTGSSPTTAPGDDDSDDEGGDDDEGNGNGNGNGKKKGHVKRDGADD